MGFKYGSGLISAASTNAKIATLAPIPSASIKIAMQVNAGILPQLSQGKMQVLRQILDPWDRPALPHRLPARLSRAQLHQSLPARLGRIHPRAHIVIGLHLNVALKFLRQLALVALPAKQPSQPNSQCPQLFHDWPSAGEMNRARISVARSHSRASRSSCLRPARVSR